MKILAIKLENINSLKGSHPIDLEPYIRDSAQIMAITGPTGSGKTSILDAVCAALYGRTPRLPKPSDMAELMTRNTANCLAEVTFSINNNKYRSRYERHKAYKKVTGKLRDANMELVDLESDKIIATKSKVPYTVEQITGLDFNRFCKSILLAQGNFDAFLKAKKDERALLLERITGTRIFSLISTKAFEKAKEEQEKLEKIRQQLSLVKLLSTDQINETTEKIKAIEKEIRQIKNRLKQLGREQDYLRSIEECRKIENECNQKAHLLEKEKEQAGPKLEFLSKTRRTNRFMKPYQELVLSEQYLEKLKHQISVNEKQIPRIEVELQKLEHGLDKAGSNLEELQNKAKEKEQVFKQVREHIPLLKNKIMQKEELEKNIQDTSAQKQFFQNDLEKTEKETKALEKNLILLKTENTNLSAQLDSLNSQHKSLLGKNNLCQLEDRFEELEKLNTMLGEKKEHMATIADLCKQIKITSKSIQNIQAEIKVNNKDLEKSEEDIRKAKAEVENLKKQREYELKIQSLESKRSELVENQPCPLCGSTDHPFRSAPPEKTQIAQKLEKSDKQLENISKARENLHKDQVKLGAEHDSLTGKQKDLEKLQKNEKQSLAKLCIPENHPSESMDEVVTSLENNKEQKTRLSKTIMSAKKSESEINTLQKTIQTTTNKLHKAEMAHQKLCALIGISQEKASHARQTFDKLTTRADAIESEIKKILDTCIQKDKSDLLDIASFLSDPAGLEKRIDQLSSESDKQIKSLKKELKNSESRILEKKSNLLANQKELKKACDSRNKQEDQVSILTDNFLQSIKKHQFRNMEEFKKHILDPEKFEKLQALEKDLEKRTIQLKTLKKDNEQKLFKLLEAPVTVSEQKELDQKIYSEETSLEHASKEIAALEYEIQENKRLSKQHAALLEKEAAQVSELRTWSGLSDLIGQKDGAKFRLFAQGLTLEQLIHKANQYLKLFNNRYILKKNNGSDLGIMVVDTYFVDEIRPMENLSGGETFLVSLSLALGLSDITSSHTNIESLFLDEGFGTLDRDTLETALAAIDTLNAFGKTVCIISHVEALKERIPIKIEVKPVSDGISTIAFHPDSASTEFVY